MASTPGPTNDLIEYAAGIIVESRKQPHTAPGHWAGALYEAGMLVAPGSHLVPRPLLDRDAVVKELWRTVRTNEYGEAANHGGAADAVVALARPMPTRDQIKTALRDRLVSSNFNVNLHEPIRLQAIDQWSDLLAGAVLSLLGGES